MAIIQSLASYDARSVKRCVKVVERGMFLLIASAMVFFWYPEVKISS